MARPERDCGRCSSQEGLQNSGHGLCTDTQSHLTMYLCSFEVSQLYGTQLLETFLPLDNSGYILVRM